MKMPFSFMNTPQEQHAVLIGWAEICCPWPARHKLTKKAEFKPHKEYHYYLFGRVLGFWTLLITIIIFTIIIAASL